MNDQRPVRAVRPRSRRSDSLRNRTKLIEVAEQTFAELGPQVSLEVIARRAGVGIGTLYRHFPLRDALIEAVCRHELEQLAEAAADLAARLPPAEALHEWMRLYVHFIAMNKIMAAAVSSMLGVPASVYRSSVAQITDNPVLGMGTELFRNTYSTMMEAMTLLLERAGGDGSIRRDIAPRELLRALAGFTVTYGEGEDGCEAGALQLVDIFMDGLRMPRAGGGGA